MLRVKNIAVWNQIRVLFLGSTFLFLANIYFGFDNALTTGGIPRWQALVHAHAGTLGWVTLSIVGFAIWILAGQRDLPDDFVRASARLTIWGIWIFGGYIVFFGLAFAGISRFIFYLLPIFGVAASIYIWICAIFAFKQTRQQDVVTNAHLLTTAALMVAALGSTMGVLLGLEYVLGFFIPGQDRIGTHAAVMDTYLLMAAAAIVDFFLAKDKTVRYNRSGLFLVIAWSISMLAIWLGLLTDIIPLLMLSVPLMLLALIVFIARGAWRAFKFNPLKKGFQTWIFFGTLWTAVWGLFFIWVAANFAEDIAAAPSWVPVTFIHLAFIGTMTNLIMAVFSARGQAAGDIMSGAEPLAAWLMNLGLIAFLGLEINSGSRLGAIVMGVGVLLGVFIMIRRLRASKTESMT